MKRIILIMLACLLLTSGCSLWQTPDPTLQIQLAVAQTMQAQPTGTPSPTPIVFPTATPESLAGLFCEYQFCIGHPNYMSFSDLNDRTSPSNYGTGKIFAFQQGLALLLTWTQSIGNEDPQSTLQAVMSSRGDTSTGTVNVQLIGNLSVTYLPITPPTQAALAYGGIATWVCGDRVFVWEAYTAQDGQAAALLLQAVQRFRCEKQ